MRVMKRKTVLVFAVAALMLAVAAGVAWAAEVTCQPNGQPCMGTDQDDQIWGGVQADTIFALAGNDSVWGRFNNDELHGEAGNDTILGGFADDNLSGDDGDDELHGETGNDTVSGGSGDDNLFGDDGTDQLVDTDDGDVPDVDSIQGGLGNDFIDVRDGDTQDRVDCGKGRRDRVARDRGDTILRNCERRARL
jgi:Ca2+-binding RTX toxin-like protein